ncbi:MAG: thioredoxin [Beduini sp.]|uniref:thioredoxin n=1 Tax=Beduini sp. TaxID=1922300 RepID=UPI0011C730BC
MKIVNSNEFDQEISTGAVLVDFFATWCGPCKMIAPVLEKLSGEYTNVKIIKVDVDQSPDIAGRYGVQSIPTLVMFKDGQPVETQVGFTGEPQLRNMLSKY